MRVGIDEAGQDDAPCGVDDERARGLLDEAVEHLRRADKQQPPFMCRQRPVVDGRHLRQFGADSRRWPGARQQRLRVAKDEVGDHLVEHN